MLKKMVGLLCCSLFLLIGAAQKITKSIAPFNILLANGKAYTYKDLPKDKAVMLIYFSPSCGHCKDFMLALVKEKKKFADRQIVMVTVDPLQDIKTFAATYNAAKYANIKIGMERSPFIVKEYYNVQHFPFVASYNAKGRLTHLITQEMKPEEIIAQL